MTIQLQGVNKQQIFFFPADNKIFIHSVIKMIIREKVSTKKMEKKLLS